MMARRFSNVYFFGLRPSFVEDAFIDKTVIDHDVCPFETGDSFYSDQIRVSRTCAYEVDFSNLQFCFTA